jgi:hypothetical protein
MDKKLNVIIVLLVIICAVLLVDSVSSHIALRGLSSQARMKSCGSDYELGPCPAELMNR